MARASEQTLCLFTGTAGVFPLTPAQRPRTTTVRNSGRKQMPECTKPTTKRPPKLRYDFTRNLLHLESILGNCGSCTRPPQVSSKPEIPLKPQRRKLVGVIFLARIVRDVTPKEARSSIQPRAKEASPILRNVLTQVNKPWFSWICVVRLDQRSKGHCKNLLGLPSRRTSTSDLGQLNQNKEIIVHCVNYSVIFEQKMNDFSPWTHG